MDKIDLDELERLAAQATLLPWHTIHGEILDAYHLKRAFMSYGEASKQNAAYIVAACNAVPKLIAKVRELERQREALAGKVCDYANRSDDIGNCICCDFSGYCGDNTTFCSDAIIRWAEKDAKEAGCA